MVRAKKQLHKKAFTSINKDLGREFVGSAFNKLDRANEKLMSKDYKTHGVLDNKWTVLIEQKTLGRAA